MILVLAILAAAAATDPTIEVVADGPVIPPRGEPLISNDAYEVTIGALLDVEMGTADTAALRIPRARLRLDALVERFIPVGMRLEVEASPFADPASNLNGPGALRDAYLRVGIGNRKVLDLGELRLGQLRVPSSAHSLRACERWRFSQRPVVEAEYLPGRDIGFVYHIDYGSHGWPVKLWIGNFTGNGPNQVQDTLASVVTGRLELAPLRWPRSSLALTTGLAVVYNSARPDLPAAVLADVRGRARRANFEVAWLVAGPAASGPLDRAALRVEGGVELLSDFLELRGRHEAFTLRSGRLEHRSTVGTVLTYLDNAFQVLFDLTLAARADLRPSGVDMALGFRVWW